MFIQDQMVDADDMLGGLTIGEIPIAGFKRRSIAIAIGGQHYRIGRIAANLAFVVIKGNLRLLFVAPGYNNYAYAARKVFGSPGRQVDYDHALGRKLAAEVGCDYILLTRLDRAINRSHGHLEKPGETSELETPSGQTHIVSKFHYTDERVFQKIVGNSASALAPVLRQAGYKSVERHERRLSPDDVSKVRWALGMNDLTADLSCLTLIPR